MKYDSSLRDRKMNLQYRTGQALQSRMQKEFWGRCDRPDMTKAIPLIKKLSK